MAAVLFGWLLVLPAAAQLPAVISIGARVAYPNASGASGSNLGKVVRDAAGNIFYLDGAKPQIVEVPVSGPVQVVVPSTDAAFSAGANNYKFTVDAAGNLYVAEIYNGSVDKISRLANGSYSLGSSNETFVTSLVSGSCDGYYTQVQELTIDTAGNLYIIGQTSSGGKGIIVGGPTYPACKFIYGSNTAAPTPVPVSIAVNAGGDVFFADGTNVQVITAAQVAAATTTTPATPTIIGNGACSGCTALAGPQTVYLDQLGNLYTSQSTTSRLSVLPNNSGFSSATPIYALPPTISGASQAGGYGVVDNQGDIIAVFGASLEFYGAGSYPNPSSSNAFGSTIAALASDSNTAKTPSIGYLFTQATTLASTPNAVLPANAAYGGAALVQFKQSATTCTGTQAVGSTCTVTIAYSPKLPGAATGAAVLYGTGNTILNELSAAAILTGPAVTVDGGVGVTVGTGYSAPAGLAVDASGNTYVADPANNAVYKYAAGSTTAGTSVGTGLSAPQGVAIDSAGDIFIADTGNSRVIYLPNNGGTLGTQVTVTTTGFTLKSPAAVAFDPLGKLYIADTGNGRILRMANPLSGGIGLPQTVGTGLTAPYGMAFDAVENMYIADKGANAVVLIPSAFGYTSTGTTNVGNGTQTTVGTGFNGPTGVAVDGSGSVYVADKGNGRIVKVASVSGATPSTQTVLVNGLAAPFGIATDNTADLYYTDQNAAKVTFLQRSAAAGTVASTIAFGSVPANGTSTLTAVVTNSGYVTTLNETTTAPASPFSTASATTPDCTSGSPLAVLAGASCNLGLVFTSPSSVGTASTGTATLTDNADNATTSPTQKISLTGYTSGPVASVTITGQSSLVYGASEIYTVTAKDSSGNPSAAANGIYTVSITGTATSSASVTLSGGTGTFYLPGIGAGSYTLSTTISSFNGTESITVAKAPLTYTATSASRLFDQANPSFTASYSGFVNGDTSSVVSGTAPTISTTATRLSSAGTYPISLSGGSLTAANYTITLVNGTLTIGGVVPQAIVFPALPNFSSGTSVTLTGVSTSGLPLTYTVTSGSATVSGSVLTITASGAVTVQASQAGNGNYAAATSVTRSFTAQ